MKTFTIIGAKEVCTSPTLHKAGRDVIATGEQDMSVSDGFHTMDDLYEHRIELWMAVCRLSRLTAWRSKLHSDGTSFEGWFVLGLGIRKGEQITYHLPMSKWEEAGFAETCERAPDFDGHTSDDVLERIKTLSYLL